MTKTRLRAVLTAVSTALDGFTEWTGKLVSWLILALVLLVSYDVGMRYLLQSGSIALQELEWHLFSLIFLLGAAYTFKHDDHVRLDLFYQSRYMNDRRRAWINLLGAVFLLLPFCLLVTVSSASFVHAAWLYNEGSPDPGGLPYRWIIKAAIPAGFVLLALQGVSSSLRNLAYLMENPR